MKSLHYSKVHMFYFLLRTSKRLKNREGASDFDDFRISKNCSGAIYFSNKILNERRRHCCIVVLVTVAIFVTVVIVVGDFPEFFFLGSVADFLQVKLLKLFNLFGTFLEFLQRDHFSKDFDLVTHLTYSMYCGE